MTVTVKILRNERQTPAGKLADAEMHFNGGELGRTEVGRLRHLGRRDGNGSGVTFPARQFTSRRAQRNFALLRAIDDPRAQNHVRELVLRAYAEHQQRLAELAS